ncbi:MAG: AraC family transcriptional regulator [Acutalibacteraceae bacterium]|nr:AraC family transcriptional regulator [Acutalibacteraceae bacterium]
MRIDQLKEMTATIYGESGAFFIPANWNMPKWAPHWHSCMEITLVLAGKIQTVIDGESYTVSEGQALIVPSAAVHSGECLSDDTIYRSIKIELSQFFNSTKASSKCLSAFLERKVAFCPLFTDQKTVSVIRDIIEANDKNQHFRVVAYFYNLIDLLYTGSSAEVDSGHSGEFYEVLHFIEANLGAPLSTKTICEKFNYNETYFCRKFKKHTGLTVTRYILLHRLEIACQLLRNEEKHVGDICSKCGFSDFSYFSAAFKRVYGITPTRFRELLSAKP